MNELEQALLKINSKDWRMSHLYKIKTKDKKLVTYKRKLAQSNYAVRKALRNLILKARQLGFTTECLLDFFDDTITNPNTNTAIVAHKQDKVVKMFEIVKRAYENMPVELRPKVSFDNRNELYFPELDSKIYVTMDTRSETVHNLHVSEAHFIRDAETMLAGTLESVPKDGHINLESTGNGVAGDFYEKWEDQDSEFKKHFYNWLWDPDYADQTFKTLEQLHDEYRPLALRFGTIMDIQQQYNLTPEQFAWYITKVKRHKTLVVQEYPTTSLEAFLATGRNVFHMNDLGKHKSAAPIERKWGELLIWEMPLKGFKYVMGVDASEGRGGDNAAIVVLNAQTGEQVAEFANNYTPPDKLGFMAIEIGKFYNSALIVPESNNHGHAVIQVLRPRYYNLYRRKVMDKVSNTETEVIGWNTSGMNKPLLVDNLEEAVREGTTTVKSEECLKEMKIFVQTDEPNKHGYGAEGSGKDDRVMAYGFAIQGIRMMPVIKKHETLTEKKLKEYAARHGLPPPSLMPDEPIFPPDQARPSTIITSRNRPNSSIRK